MRPIRKRTYPRRTARAAPALAFLRKLATARMLWGGSRHLAWTVSITGRLVGRDLWRGMQPGPMVLVRASRNYILLRTLLRQLQPGSRAAPAEMPERARAGRSEGTMQRPCGGLRLATDILALARKPMQIVAAPMIWEAAHRRELRSLKPMTGVQENLALALAPKRSGLPGLQPPSSDAMPAAPAVLSGAKRALVQPWLRPWEKGDGPDSRLGDMPGRVMRKHRRVEQRAYPPGGDFVVTNMLRPVMTEAVTLAGPRFSKPAQEYEAPVAKREPSVAHLQPEPAVNVTRITDEVLKQLDRRLIAARERRGRI